MSSESKHDEFVWNGNNLEELLAWAESVGRPIQEYRQEGDTLIVPDGHGGVLTIKPEDSVVPNPGSDVGLTIIHIV